MTESTAALAHHARWKYRAQLTVVLLSILANSMASGGIFLFPLLAPALAEHLRLTQPQLSSIALAGMMGQYPLAALVGLLVDRAGSGVCSLLAAALFATGWGLFSLEISRAPVYPDPATPLQYHILVLSFALLGLGAVCSYFSSMMCAIRNFPQFSGAASGTSMALFGLSPLVLSLVASTAFTSADAVLDVTHFTAFMAVFAGGTHAVGALLLRVLSRPPPATNLGVDNEAADETTALIPKPVAPDLLDRPVGQDGSVRRLLADSSFGVLFVCSFCILGICEMIISNIGTITLSLPVRMLSTSPSTNSATQVRIISVANTVSRLVFGLAADLAAPVAAHLSSGEIVFPRKHYVSRVVFLVTGSASLAAALAWMLFGVSSQSGVWLLSLGTGVAYGAFWAILPGLVSAIWGTRDAARNFGLTSYAAFLGTPAFTFLYAAGAGRQPTGDDGICHGRACWEGTMVYCGCGVAAALLGLAHLWRAWRGRV